MKFNIDNFYHFNISEKKKTLENFDPNTNYKPHIDEYIEKERTKKSEVKTEIEKLKGDIDNIHNNINLQNNKDELEKMLENYMRNVDKLLKNQFKSNTSEEFKKLPIDAPINIMNGKATESGIIIIQNPFFQ